MPRKPLKKFDMVVTGHSLDGPYVTIEMEAAQPLRTKSRGVLQGTATYKLPYAVPHDRGRKLLIGMGYLESQRSDLPAPELRGLGSSALKHVQQRIFRNLAKQAGKPVVHAPEVIEDSPARSFWLMHGYEETSSFPRAGGGTIVVLKKEYSGQGTKKPSEKEQAIIGLLKSNLPK